MFPDQSHLHVHRPGPDAVSDHPAPLPLSALHLGLHLTGLDLPPGKQVEAASVVLLCADVGGGGGGGGGGGTSCPPPGAPSHRP